MHDRSAYSRGLQVAGAMLLSVCVLLGVCSCSAAGHEGKVDIPPADTSNIARSQPNEVAKGSATKIDPVERGVQVSVDVTLSDCESGPSLPIGFSRDDDSHFSEFIDETGNVGEGYAFVQIRLDFTNPNDFDCRLDLGGCRLCSLSGDGSGIPGSTEPWWVRDRERNDKNYFMPTLSAGASASYVLGYVVPNETLASGDTEVLLGYDRIGLETKNIRTIDITSLVAPSS